MYKAFIKNLIYNLCRNDFYFSTSLPENVSDVSKKQFFIYEKVGHHSYYIVNIVNTSLLSDSEFLSVNDYLKSNVKTIVEKNNFKNAVIINLFISEYKNNIHYEAEPFTNQQINNIFWEINLKDKNITVNENQPTKIIGLDKIINASFEPIGILNSFEGTAEEISELSKKTSTIRKRTEKPIFTYLFIAINIIIFILMTFNGGSQDFKTLVLFGALDHHRTLVYGEYWRIVSCIFVHIGISHLAFNTLSLYIFGNIVEKYLGHTIYILIYLATGICGNILSLIFDNPAIHIISAGASGAIYGLVGCLAALTFKSKRNIEGFTFYQISIFVLFGAVYGIVKSEINNYAHFGGLVSGLLFGLIIYSLMDYRNKKSLEKNYM